MENQILVLALRGRDSQVLATSLSDAGYACQICSNIDAMVEQLSKGAALALITEESLDDGGLPNLICWLQNQDTWSDFPIVLLATKRAGRRPHAAQNVIAQLGNVILLERPIHGETLVGAVKSSMRGRTRQYEARRRMSELKAAETQLWELNRHLETRVYEQWAEFDRLWTLSEDLLARADYNGGMIAVSPAWTSTLGYSEHELLTRPYAEIIHPDDGPTVIRALELMRLTGQPTRFENSILSSNGNYLPFGWTVSPEPDGVHFIAIGRNLASEKKRERELAQSQDQLRQAQKMEAVGQLTGGIAHDFNNLLQGITGSLEIIKRRIGQNRLDDLDRFISGAVTSANRAAALTHRLLAFSRRQPLDARAVEANPLVQSMAELLHSTLGENISLELALTEGLWPTLCDPNQLENAILNLAINARDAMPDGGTLTVETENVRIQENTFFDSDLAAGAYICICVTDDGAGMPHDVVARAFDPFFTTKAIGQGTGLGLSMIYGFVRQSGGDVKIDSNLGRGTSIRLYLPRYSGKIDPDEEHASVSELHAAQLGEVVVVIDDEPVVRGLIVDVLGELGYQALEAEDGPTGLALLQTSTRVDLLITDIGLPGLNGRQVADAARTSRPNLKVLFMTGYAETAAVAEGFLDHGMSLLTKPFAMEVLATRIRSIIEDN